MAQHDQVIDNGPGRAVRLDINAAFQALFSTNSGVLEPAITVGGQLWFDESDPSNPKLMLRNAGNTAWLDIATDLSSSNFVYTSGAVSIAPEDITNFIQFSATGTANLPAAAGLPDTWWITISAFGGPVTIQPRVGDLIDGSPSIIVPKGTTVSVRATGDGVSFRSSGFPLTTASLSTIVAGLPVETSLAGTDNLVVVHADGSLAQVSKDLFGSPSGMMQDYAGQTVPSGYLPANGAAVSRTTYAPLFAAIGTAWGVGDGSTTFNVPDGRGVTKRGWDNGRGLDPSRAFGSYQADLLGTHTHALTDPGHRHIYDIRGGSQGGPRAYPADNTFTTDVSQYTRVATTGITIDAAGGAETRMKNIATLSIIKY